MLSASDDFDGDDGSRLAFLEERIDRFQQHGLEAGSHLRNLGVHSCCSVEIKRLVAEFECALEPDERARHAKGEPGKGHDAVPQLKPTFQIGGDIVQVWRLFGLPY